MLACLTLALLPLTPVTLSPVTLPPAPVDDDLVPAAVEALIAAPEDPFPFGLPVGLAGPTLFSMPTALTVRCLADAGDADGDGAPDLAVGYGRAPDGGSPAADLEVRSGRTGDVLWSARVGGGFRSLRGLAVHGRLLATAPESRGGRVECRDAATGARLWQRSLAPGARVTLHAAEWVADPLGDGVPDLAVAGGRGLDAVVLLSGADGSILWQLPAGDVTYDLRVVDDRDGDGRQDLAAVGGDDAPFVRLLSTRDGEIIAEEALPGPGSAVLVVDDLDGAGVADLVVGMFNAPGPCLRAVDGATLASIWTAAGMVHDVTSLDRVGDLLRTGVGDVVVGSTDNAVSAWSMRHGLSIWRREVSTFNGGHMLAVAALGDLDGDGTIDVAAGSFDGQVYVMGGIEGQFLSVTPARGRQLAVARLGDGDGDGRPEWGVGGVSSLAALDGAGGLASGPFVTVDPMDEGGEFQLDVHAFPGTGLLLLVGPDRDHVVLPGLQGALLLHPATLWIHFQGTAPGAGIAGFVLGPFPGAPPPAHLHVQALSLDSPGSGKFSNAVTLDLTR